MKTDLFSQAVKRGSIERLILAMALLVSATTLRAAEVTSNSLAGMAHDPAGSVYDVKSFGAAGDGAAGDSAFIQKAIDAAVKAGGGLVFIPAGSYIIDKTLVNPRADLVSLAGSGMGSTLKISAAVGLSLLSLAGLQAQFHGGTVEHLRFACMPAFSGIAVQMTDIIVPPILNDLTVSQCEVGFDLVNKRHWTERLSVTNIADHFNKHLFHFDQDPADDADSYGYGNYAGIYINKSAGQDVFWLTGGAYVYHSNILIKGNFNTDATSASIFNVQGAAGKRCPGAGLNTYDIAVEGGGYSVVNAANNGCHGGSMGNALVEGSGSIRASGAVTTSSGSIREEGTIARLMGVLSTTAAESDVLAGAPAVSPSSHCFVEATNAVASAMSAATFVSAVGWGSATVTHPPHAGAAFQIWCSAR